ncbi:hypothetical protein H109_07009 [Trichophyton interdigitale MR816]|uniref:Uncharacterized protein n=1 Tax=Trichophyton interdigitale (strain MR816) TaxID=1215338 RepID=A0A059IZU1_TRIIM|nr:hypothetical protein H101_03491 [Trichophyton interdigitale H6]KDB21044.1 hypothetical protein H109_07009 [Trichophyton interdigitale MR816]
MHLPVLLLFPILALANPAPISLAPKNPLGSLRARSANYCCQPFPPGSKVSLLESELTSQPAGSPTDIKSIWLTILLNDRAGASVEMARLEHHAADMGYSSNVADIN